VNTSNLIHILLLLEVHLVHLAHEIVQVAAPNILTSFNSCFLPRQFQTRLIERFNEIFSEGVESFLVRLKTLRFIKSLEHPILFDVARLIFRILATNFLGLN
jgi:hypothetical protein